MKYCQNCHCAASDDAIRCPNCGIPLEKKPIQNSKEQNKGREFTPTPPTTENKVQTGFPSSNGESVTPKKTVKKYISKESVYGSNEVYTSAVTFLDYALKGLAVLIAFAGLMLSGWVSRQSESFFTFFIGLLITIVIVAFTMAVDLAIIETMKNIISITENAKAMRKLYEQEINEKAENDK